RKLMLHEAGAKHLLYVGELSAEDEWLAREESLRITYIAAETGRESEGHGDVDPTQSLPAIAPDDAAYIFFTSGTTGTPKGILGCHKGLSHFLQWQSETFRIGPSDRAAQLTTLSFDVVLRDIFTPLVSGATLCLPDEPDNFGPDQLIAWLGREKITCLHTVPSLAQYWLAHSSGRVPLPDLRYVFFAGEPLLDTLVRRWREVLSETGEIINLYGPTETTLAKCFYRVPQVPAV